MGRVKVDGLSWYKRAFKKEGSWEKQRKDGNWIGGWKYYERLNGGIE